LLPPPICGAPRAAPPATAGSVTAHRAVTIDKNAVNAKVVPVTPPGNHPDGVERKKTGGADNGAKGSKGQSEGSGSGEKHPLPESDRGRAR
jgi:hypothetical protein